MIHARIQKVLSEGANFANGFFCVSILADEGSEDPNTTLNGPSSARQRNAT